MEIHSLYKQLLEIKLKVYATALKYPKLLIAFLILISSASFFLKDHLIKTPTGPTTGDSPLTLVLYPSQSESFSRAELCLIQKWTENLQVFQPNIKESFHLFQVNQFGINHNRLTQASIVDNFCLPTNAGTLDLPLKIFEGSPWEPIWFPKPYSHFPISFKISNPKDFKISALSDQLDRHFGDSQIRYHFFGDWVENYHQKKNRHTENKTAAISLYLILFFVFFFRSQFGSNLFAFTTLTTSHLVYFTLFPQIDVRTLVLSTLLSLRYLYLFSHFPNPPKIEYFKNQASAIITYTIVMASTLGTAMYIFKDISEVYYAIQNLLLLTLVQLLFTTLLFPALVLLFPAFSAKKNTMPLQFFSHMNLLKNLPIPKIKFIALIIALLGVAAIVHQEFKIDALDMDPTLIKRLGWNQKLIIEFQNIDNETSNKEVIDEVRKLPAVRAVLDPYQSIRFPYAHIPEGFQTAAREMNLTSAINQNLLLPPYKVKLNVYLKDSSSKELVSTLSQIRQICSPSQCHLKGNTVQKLTRLQAFNGQFSKWLITTIILVAFSFVILVGIVGAKPLFIISSTAFLTVLTTIGLLKVLSVVPYLENWLIIPTVLLISMQELICRAFLKFEKDGSYISFYISGALLSVSLFSVSSPPSVQLGWCLFIGILVSFYENFRIRGVVDPHAWSVKRV